MATVTREQKAIERLRTFARLRGIGGCRVISIGDACECVLCDLDAVAAALSAPPASDPPGLTSLTRSLCEALWDMQSSPDCWCPHDRAVTEPHTEACAAARAVNGAAKRFHLYDELPLPASPQAKED